MSLVNTPIRIALAIIRHPSEDQYLIARRKRGTHLENMWEFPGGKCFEGETPEKCAVRETLEETGLQVQILEEWTQIIYDYTVRTVCLFPVLCVAMKDSAKCLESQEVRWVAVTELDQYEFPPANTPVLERLKLQI